MRLTRAELAVALVPFGISAFLYGAPAGAHTSSTYYFGANKWLGGTNISYYFHTSLPDTADWRNSVRFGDDQWDAVGGTNEPDFLAQTVSPSGYLCSGGGIGNTRSAIHYGALDGVGNAIGLTTTCILAGGSTASAFRIIFDSAETWYSGSGNAPATSFDARSVATHEFGHATGFYGHFPADSTDCLSGGASTDQTMCSALTRGEEHFRTLGVHDTHTFDGAY